MSPSAWLFCDTPIGGVYGASYMAESWARELRSRGWQVRTVSPSGSWRRHADTPDERAFRTIRHIGRPNDEYALYSMVAEVLRARRERPDVIVVTTPLRVGMLGFAIAQRLGVPLVVAVSTDTTGMSQFYSSVRMIVTSWPKVAFTTLGSASFWRGLRRALRHTRSVRTSWSVRIAAASVAGWESEASALVLLGERSRAPWHDPARVNVFPAGIDRLPREPDGGDPVIDWPAGALRVLYVGRFSKEKSLPTLLHATQEARARGVDLHLGLVGGGHIAHELRALAAQLGIEEHVSFRDAVPRGQLGAVYRAADVFAFPSVVDTQAFVLNEAAHEGLPLVTAASVNPVVLDGRTACVVGRQAAAFAEAFERLQDPELRARLGAAAPLEAMKYSEAAQADRLHEVLLGAVGVASTPQATATMGPVLALG